MQGGLLLLPAEGVTNLFLATLVCFAFICCIFSWAPLKDAEDGDDALLNPVCTSTSDK